MKDAIPDCIPHGPPRQCLPFLQIWSVCDAVWYYGLRVQYWNHLQALTRVSMNCFVDHLSVLCKNLTFITFCTRNGPASPVSNAWDCYRVHVYKFYGAHAFMQKCALWLYILFAGDAFLPSCCAKNYVSCFIIYTDHMKMQCPCLSFDMSLLKRVSVFSPSYFSGTNCGCGFCTVWCLCVLSLSCLIQSWKYNNSV